MDLNAWMLRCPVIAILRGVRPDEVLDICAALHQAGIAIVEVPLNSPSALESIAILTRQFGDRMLIGAGTLTSPTQIEPVAAAGGRVILTPHADLRIVYAARSAGLWTIPGFSTATEAFALIEAGADAIKFFPAGVHGLMMYKALRAVLPPETSVVAVGAIEPADVVSWFSVGVKALGIGSALYSPGDTPEKVHANAGRFLREVRRFVED